MYNNRFFKYMYSILLILAIIFLLGQIDYIIRPIKNVFALLSVPLLMGVFLYYLLRPIVRFLTNLINNKPFAILISFVLVIVIIIFVVYFGGSIIGKQVENLINNFSNYFELVKNNFQREFQDEEGLYSYLEQFKIQERITAVVENIFNKIRRNIYGFFSTLTNIGTILVLIPFVVFYFLKDDTQIYHSFIKLFPEKKQKYVEQLLIEIDNTLSRYISGQLIIAIILGLLTLLGYLLIGLPNALILALIAMVTSFIPFIGPIIGILPAIFIGLTTDLTLILKILIVLIVVQQLEGNIIQPKIQGKRLEIHPLIVIFSVLSFIILFGFLGSLFAVPSYAVARVVIKNIKNYKI